MARALFLTGRPGVGKTTVIKAVARSLGPLADGFYTEEIRSQGKREGFRLVTLAGATTTLAHTRLTGPGVPHVGRYGVDVEALDRVGVAALERAIANGRIIVLDEIGKMELFSTPFKRAVLDALEAHAPIIATVMARPHPWVDPLKTHASVTIWQVTLQNRDELPSQALAWLRPRDEN